MPPPPMDRREFLKAAGMAAAATALAGCDSPPVPSGPAAATISTGPVHPVVPLPAPAAPPHAVPEPGSDASNFHLHRVAGLTCPAGLARGDPLSDRVIIWTRITEITPSAASIPVAWEVSTSPTMTPLVKSGSQSTLAERDWTVKVDVTGLTPATTYYYRFSALGPNSILGRPRTPPSVSVAHYRLPGAPLTRH